MTVNFDPTDLDPSVEYVWGLYVDFYNGNPVNVFVEGNRLKDIEDFQFSLIHEKGNWVCIPTPMSWVGSKHEVSQFFRIKDVRGYSVAKVFNKNYVGKLNETSQG